MFEDPNSSTAAKVWKDEGENLLNILCSGVGDSELIIPSGIHTIAYTLHITSISGGSVNMI